MGALFNLFAAFGLSSAAGLNAYIPLLVVGLGVRFDLWQIQAPYDLLASPLVLTILAIVALADFLADKIPVVDHITHMLGLVIHPVAGAILFASQTNVLTNVHPVVALLAGVAVAGSFHAARTTVRPFATATTGGIANPLLSLLEDIFALILSVLAFVLPILAFVLFVLLLVVLFVTWRKVRRRIFRPS